MMGFSHCYHGANLEVPSGWSAFSTLDRGSAPFGLQAWEGTRKSRPLRVVQLKRKETWDFRNRHSPALRLAETITLIRSSWSPGDPGSFQTWARVLGQQGWPSLVPQSPRLQISWQEDHECLPPKGSAPLRAPPVNLPPAPAPARCPLELGGG